MEISYELLMVLFNDTNIEYICMKLVFYCSCHRVLFDFLKNKYTSRWIKIDLFLRPADIELYVHNVKWPC